MAKNSKAKAEKPVSKKTVTPTATESTAQSKRPFGLCGGAEATQVGEWLEDAAIALEGLGVVWEEQAKKIVDGVPPANGDAILMAGMRFGEARRRILRVLRQGVMDRGDGVGRAWMLSISGTLDTVLNELDAPNATMTDLSTELARAARLSRLANRLRAAQRELAYGHIVAAETVEAKDDGPSSTTDRSAYIVASALWPNYGFESYNAFKMFLKDYGVDNHQEGQRRMVHAADCLRAIAERDRKAEAAEDIAGDVLEGIKERTEAVRKESLRRKRQEK